MTSLTLSDEATVENLYRISNGLMCSPNVPQEDEICKVGGKSQTRLLNEECLESTLEWNLKDKRFVSHFTSDQLNKWLQEYAAPCQRIEVLEESNNTIRIRQKIGKARITLVTYEATDVTSTDVQGFRIYELK